AARFTGIPVARRLMVAFALSGLLAGLGGWMFAARFAGVDATSANGFEFAVVTAVVIGGVNVFGGSGSVLGAMLGALLVATIDNGFTLLRLSEFWKIFFEGAAIVVLIGVLNLPSLAVTLGTLAAYRGLAFVILGGNARSGFPSSFTQIGGGYIHNELPVALLVMLGAAFVLGLLLHTTRFGRYL